LNDLSEASKTLKRAVAVARENPAAALALFNDGLVRARSSGDDHGVSLLAKHAGALARELGNYQTELGYYEEALIHEPADGYLYWAFGDVHRRLGHLPKARTAFERCLALATEQQDDDLVEMASRALAAMEADAG
jgi:tetratricopeptide (TPR) repeat protein